MKDSMNNPLLCTSLTAVEHPITHAVNYAGHNWIALDKKEALKDYGELSIRNPSITESINRGIKRLVCGTAELKRPNSRASAYTVSPIASCREIYELRLPTIIQTNNKRLFIRIVFAEAFFIKDGRKVRGIVTLGVTVKESYKDGGSETQQKHLEKCCNRYRIWVSQQPKLR